MHFVALSGSIVENHLKIFLIRMPLSESLCKTNGSFCSVTEISLNTRLWPKKRYYNSFDICGDLYRHNRIVGDINDE